MSSHDNQRIFGLLCPVLSARAVQGRTHAAALKPAAFKKLRLSNDVFIEFIVFPIMVHPPSLCGNPNIEIPTRRD
jgi:hypothetical protein